MAARAAPATAPPVRHALREIGCGGMAVPNVTPVVHGSAGTGVDTAGSRVAYAWPAHVLLRARNLPAALLAGEADSSASGSGAGPTPVVGWLGVAAFKPGTLFVVPALYATPPPAKLSVRHGRWRVRDGAWCAGARAGAATAGAAAGDGSPSPLPCVIASSAPERLLPLLGRPVAVRGWRLVCAQRPGTRNAAPSGLTPGDGDTAPRGVLPRYLEVASEASITPLVAIAGAGVARAGVAASPMPTPSPSPALSASLMAVPGVTDLSRGGQDAFRILAGMASPHPTRAAPGTAGSLPLWTPKPRGSAELTPAYVRSKSMLFTPAPVPDTPLPSKALARPPTTPCAVPAPVPPPPTPPPLSPDSTFTVSQLAACGARVAEFRDRVVHVAGRAGTVTSIVHQGSGQREVSFFLVELVSDDEPVGNDAHIATCSDRPPAVHVLFNGAGAMGWHPFLCPMRQYVITDLVISNVKSSAKHRGTVLRCTGATRVLPGERHARGGSHADPADGCLSQDSVNSVEQHARSSGPADGHHGGGGDDGATTAAAAAAPTLPHPPPARSSRPPRLVSYEGVITSVVPSAYVELDGNPRTRVWVCHLPGGRLGCRPGARVVAHNLHPLLLRGKLVGLGACMNTRVRCALMNGCHGDPPPS